METGLIINTIEKIEDKDTAMRLMVQFLTEMSREFKTFSETARTCKQEWVHRVETLESHVIGIDGANGIKMSVKQHEQRIDMMERSLEKWVARITTALVIINITVVPLVVWIFFHFIKGGTP